MREDAFHNVGIIDECNDAHGDAAVGALERITDVDTEEEAVALIVEGAKTVPKGEWIVGQGWDEGAWANQMALDTAGITSETEVPVGGEMRLGTDGQSNGLFLNNAVELIRDAVPPPSREAYTNQLLIGLSQMAADGYAAVHEAGLGSLEMSILKELESEGRLPTPVLRNDFTTR